MDKLQIQRREFLKLIASIVPAAAIDWNAFPLNHAGPTATDDYDAIVIGSGLGGLSCAAAFARRIQTSRH